MATAHLIQGYIGAGKTSFARELEARLPAVRFTHDKWMAALYGRDPPADRFPELFRRVSDLIGAQWTRCLELGLDVVLDLNFWSRAQRDEVRARVASLGAKHRLYHLNVPDEEAWTRVARRNQEPGALHIARSTFELLRARYEPLGADAEHEVGACGGRGPGAAATGD